MVKVKRITTGRSVAEVLRKKGVDVVDKLLVEAENPMISARLRVDIFSTLLKYSYPIPKPEQSDNGGQVVFNLQLAPQQAEKLIGKSSTSTCDDEESEG
ncbi:MAG: hypothetical protein EOM12_14390 [Verrucomicrobiae bacterium]|nr:hypothetical protein [Verrucomicrobiae bacterium]